MIVVVLMTVVMIITIVLVVIIIIIIIVVPTIITMAIRFIQVRRFFSFLQRPLLCQCQPVPSAGQYQPDWRLFTRGFADQRKSDEIQSARCPVSDRPRARPKMAPFKRPQKRGARSFGGRFHRSACSTAVSSSCF
jgi:hypothetical protein